MKTVGFLLHTCTRAENALNSEAIIFVQLSEGILLVPAFPKIFSGSNDHFFHTQLYELGDLPVFLPTPSTNVAAGQLSAFVLTLQVIY